MKFTFKEQEKNSEGKKTIKTVTFELKYNAKLLFTVVGISKWFFSVLEHASYINLV